MNRPFTERLPGLLVSVAPYFFLVFIILAAIIAQLSDCHFRSITDILDIGFTRRIEILG